MFDSPQPAAVGGLWVGGASVTSGHGAGTEEDNNWVSIAWVPGRRTIRCRWAFILPRRGVYPLTAPSLTTGFPFGLWENKRVLSVESQLIVWPRTYPVGPVPMVCGDQQIEGNVSRNKVGSNGDVLGVRPYRRGDSPRRIHWGQRPGTTGSLSVSYSPTLVRWCSWSWMQILPFTLGMGRAAHSNGRSALSQVWPKAGIASGVEVGTVWNTQVISPAAGPKQLNALLDGLAKLPDTAGTALSETMDNSACRSFSEGLQIIVTTDVGIGLSDSRRMENISAVGLTDAGVPWHRTISIRERGQIHPLAGSSRSRQKDSPVAAN